LPSPSACCRSENSGILGQSTGKVSSFNDGPTFLIERQTFNSSIRAASLPIPETRSTTVRLDDISGGHRLGKHQNQEASPIDSEAAKNQNQVRPNHTSAENALRKFCYNYRARTRGQFGQIRTQGLRNSAQFRQYPIRGPKIYLDALAPVF